VLGRADAFLTCCCAAVALLCPAGTIVYMPSELLLTGRMTTATDIYSFGLMSECQQHFTREPCAHTHTCGDVVFFEIQQSNVFLSLSRLRGVDCSVTTCKVLAGYSLLLLPSYKVYLELCAARCLTCCLLLLPAATACRRCLLLLPAAVWELYTSQRVFEEGLSIGQIFYMSEWPARLPCGCCTATRSAQQ
jgi:hypothetical protein